MSLTSLLPWPKTFAAHLRKKRCDYNFFFPVQTVALFIFLPNLCVLVIIMIQTHIHTPFTMKLSIVYKISLWIVATTLEPCGDNTQKVFLFFVVCNWRDYGLVPLFFFFLNNYFVYHLLSVVFFFLRKGKGTKFIQEAITRVRTFFFLEFGYGRKVKLVRGKKRKKAFGWLAPYLCVCVVFLSHIGPVIISEQSLKRNHHCTPHNVVGRRKYPARKVQIKRQEISIFFCVCVSLFNDVEKGKKDFPLVGATSKLLSL